MQRDDFVFSIGFHGETAIVDGHAKKLYSKLSTKELLEKGLLKTAFCSALFSGDQKEVKDVLENYNRIRGSNYNSIEDLKRLFGVFSVTDNIKKVSVI